VINAQAFDLREVEAPCLNTKPATVYVPKAR
jgi:hypothetical protein